MLQISLSFNIKIVQLLKRVSKFLNSYHRSEGLSTHIYFLLPLVAIFQREYGDMKHGDGGTKYVLGSGKILWEKAPGEGPLSP